MAVTGVLLDLSNKSILEKPRIRLLLSIRFSNVRESIEMVLSTRPEEGNTMSISYHAVFTFINLGDTYPENVSVQHGESRVSLEEALSDVRKKVKEETSLAFNHERFTSSPDRTVLESVSIAVQNSELSELNAMVAEFQNKLSAYHQ